MVNEVRIMYSLNHPYILKLYNHFEDDVNISLVLEFAPGVILYFFIIYSRDNFIRFCGNNQIRDLMKKQLQR
jgi:serine/threonine protein kinase